MYGKKHKVMSHGFKKKTIHLKQQYPVGIATLRQEKISYHSSILKGISHTMLSLNMPRRRVPFRSSN